MIGTRSNVPTVWPHPRFPGCAEGLDEPDQKESKVAMQAPSPFFIAHSILPTPAWARLGITVPDSRLRERAAEELAIVIMERREKPPVIHDAAQLPLPL